MSKSFQLYLFCVFAFIFCFSFMISANAADDWILQDGRYFGWTDGFHRHAMAYAGNDNVVFFGGNSGFDNDDTCIYDLSADSWTCRWPNPRPGFRKDAGMAYIGDDKVLLHGGYNDGVTDPSPNDTWVYDVSNRRWTDMNPVNEILYDTVEMAYIGDDKAVLFTGNYRYDVYPEWYNWSSTEVYDLSDNTWTQVTPATSPPGRRHSAMARIGPDKVVMHGGLACRPLGVSTTCDPVLGDTWVYDLSDNTWINMNPVTTPGPRLHHDMAYIGGDKVVMFGGLETQGDPTPQDDTWVYDLSDNTWTLDTNGINPPGLHNHAMAATSMTGVSVAVLFGGTTDWVGNDRSDQTWTFGGGDFVLTEAACFDGLDNDGDGNTDCVDSDCDGATSGSCDTGQPGICSPGILTCSTGVAACIADSGPLTEGPPGDLSCSDALDNDCDATTDIFDMDCVDGNTVPGSDVEICDGTSTACVTFDNVLPPGGDTTVTVVACDAPPDGIIFNHSDPTCVDIQTTAPFDLARVCVPYDDAVCIDPDPTTQLLCELSTFDMFRCDSGACVPLPKEQDTDANIVCGLTDGFSLFFVGTALDTDNDGIVDIDDNCPLVSNFFQNNSDLDSVGDACDNCTIVSNESQLDTDADNYGNYCDPDFDNNMVVNASDLAFFKTKFFSSDPDADLTGDGIVNAADLAILKAMFFGPPGPSGLVP